MEDFSSSAWMRRGSSVVFHPAMLGPLLDGGCLVSLREALGWMGSWPDSTPSGSDTVLVGGLEACIEVMSPEEAEEFLRCRIKPLIQEFQSHWDQRGLVFGFGCSGKRFEIDTFDEVFFVGPGDHRVRLSAGLWNGAAKQDMFRLITTNPETGREEHGGFYVRRLS